VTEPLVAEGRRGMAHHPGLDGVRASALVMIMIYHSEPTWMPGGFISVSLFFTLSGYLITSLLLFEGEGNSRVSLRRFWERRLRRLAPASLVALVSVVLLSTWLSTTVEQARVRGDAVSAALYVANWNAIFSGHSYSELFADESPLQHLWSLSIEEQLYVLVPLIVALGFVWGLGRRGIGLVFVGLSVLSILAAVVAEDPDRIYYGTDTRAVELFAGAVLACFLSPRLERWATGKFRWINVIWLIPLILYVLFSRIVDPQSPWLYDGWLGIFVLVNLPFCIGAMIPGPMRRIMSTSILTLLGRMSYGIYLAHWPVFVWVDEDVVGLSGAPLLAVRFAVTFAIAAVSYRFIEQPIRTRKLLARNRLAGAVGSLAFVAVVVMPLVVLPGRAPAQSTEVRVLSTVAPTSTASIDTEEVPSPSAAPGPSTSPPGVGADPEGPLTVLILGDSVAENIALAFSRAGDGELGVISGGVLGCPLQQVELVHRRVDEDQNTSYCPDNIRLIDENSESIDLVFVVASVANQWDYRPLGSSDRVVVGSERYVDDLGRWLDSVRAITSPSTIPLVFLESPEVADEPMLNGDTEGPRSAWNDVMMSWDETYDDVVMMPYDDLLADPESSEGRRQRPDGTHLEEEFAVTLAREQLIPRLRSAYSEAMEAVRRP
jgi:peptidoglycan/LPS O-acetylase OafA/YrhL